MLTRMFDLLIILFLYIYIYIVYIWTHDRITFL